MTGSPRRNPRMAAQLAEKWLQDEGITQIPVRPKEIAAKLDILVEPAPATGPGVSGMLLRHGNAFAIAYATYIPSKGFQNFSIAHELGHYLLDGHPEALFANEVRIHVSRAGFVSGEWYEQEADHFAAGFLMPEHPFKTALRGAPDGLDGIQQLADLCETSLTATAIRYAQSTSIPAAVIMSTDGRIDYCFMSRALEEFDGLRWPRKGDLLPDDVPTATFARDSKNVTSGRRETDTSDLRRWLGARRSVNLTEEMLGLGAYGKVLTVLSAERFADEDVDDDEEMNERWTPRFRR